MGSSGVVVFTRARAGGRWVHPGLLGSLARDLGVVGFFRGRWFHSRAPCGRFVHSRSLDSLAHALCVVGFIRGRWAHMRSPLGRLVHPRLLS